MHDDYRGSKRHKVWLWATVRDAQTHLLVRVRQNRRLFDQEDSLYTYLSTQPCEGTYTVQVVADPRRQQTAREAWLAVRVQNPHPPNSLAWATWLIARLGGWSGYRS